MSSVKKMEGIMLNFVNQGFLVEEFHQKRSYKTFRLLLQKRKNQQHSMVVY